jgi:hypothetical protein
MQEEHFLKSNLDYENRLKEHIYQFEENKSAISMGKSAATIGDQTN